MIPNLSFSNLSNLIQNTPPALHRSPSASSTQARIVPVNVNNRVIYVAGHLEKDVRDAVALIGRDHFNAESLKKELILNSDILIALLNQAKLYWHSWVSKTQGKDNASEQIESGFINNKNLSKEESDWVKETIQTYKNNIQDALLLNTVYD